MTKLPDQRWLIKPNDKDVIANLVELGITPIAADILINRGITTQEDAAIYLEPESQTLPKPIDEFPDLQKSIDILIHAINNKISIVICGDYDADGMTSTALLLRIFKHLGATADYAIPSRMTEGYGINERIVREFAEAKYGLIITVDNGITAHKPIALAIELGLQVIITDHHELPSKLPPANAILNPKLLRASSPYSGLAGVGVAYILAITLAQQLGKTTGIADKLLELFTLGTIADMVPLVGVNRKFIKRGLWKLSQSKIPGVQSLIQVSGVADKQIKPSDIGFKLAPRINAVGRIGDPQVVIDLLSTDDDGIALQRAMQCETANSHRQHLCTEIEKQAHHEAKRCRWKDDRVLVLSDKDWHHGIIGIVASRMVERYGVPTFIVTYDEKNNRLRGSARGIEGFNVFAALDFCKDILITYGGHKAAGGFSLPEQNLSVFQDRLSVFAKEALELEQIKPQIKIDGHIPFSDLTIELFDQIESMQPWGIENRQPIFWTSNCKVIEQRIVGQDHLKLKLEHSGIIQNAIAWRWKAYYPLPDTIDVAYKLQENIWNGQTTLQLQLEGARDVVGAKAFTYHNRNYHCVYKPLLGELRIKNDSGKVLLITGTQGVIGETRESAQPVDLSTPFLSNLVSTAYKTLRML